MSTDMQEVLEAIKKVIEDERRAEGQKSVTSSTFESSPGAGPTDPAEVEKFRKRVLAHLSGLHVMMIIILMMNIFILIRIIR